MSKSLLEALGNGAWSVSTIVFDLDDMIDDEGRPISERRAGAAARVGVKMEMRECPYAGIRRDKLMNVSALEQISNHYNTVIAEMAAFRRQAAGEHATWDDILAGVIDLLAYPAVYLLQQRNAHGPVPASIAVGHKLAAGYFGVLRSLHERLAQGENLPVTVDSFLTLVDETGALVGASEVCAGSPQMIRRTSTALLEGRADNQTELDPLRLKMARCLALQMRLGIFWQLYDRVHLWRLVRGEHRAYLIPFNDFLNRKLNTVEDTLDKSAPPQPDVAMLPASLNAQLRGSLAEALRDAVGQQMLEEDVRTATGLLNEPGSAIRFSGEITPFAQHVAHYLHTHRLFIAELSRLELELRGYLGFSADAPISLGAAVYPAPQALHWYELILGQRLGKDGHLTGSNTGVRVVELNLPPYP